MGCSCRCCSCRNLSAGFLFATGLALNELEACGVAEDADAEIRCMFYSVLLQIGYLTPTAALNARGARGSRGRRGGL